MKKLVQRAAAPAVVLAVSLAPATSGAASVPAAAGSQPASQGRAAPGPGTFNVASFNVHGGSHTKGRGGLRSGSSRVKGAVPYLRKHHVTVAGLQELEGRQARGFLKQTKRRWGLVGAPSRSGKSVDLRNAVAYRKSSFAVQQRRHVPIRYFHGKRVNVPLVKLRTRATGQTFWVLNTHNPADIHGPAGKWRAQSVRSQLKVIERLHRRGQTVLYTGDMNAKREFFCRATRSGTLKSASGGSHGKRCVYPKRNAIDWVLGTKDVGFSHWRSDKTTRSRGISDHPIIVATVDLPG